MLTISICLVSLAALSACVDAARISRKDKTGDCYSKYDGQTLLHLTPCTTQEVFELSRQLKRLECTFVGDELEVPRANCADLDVVCSPGAAAKLVQRSDVSNISSDAGAYWRSSSGVTQAFVEGLHVTSDFYSNWRDLYAQMNRVESVVRASGGRAKIETVGKSLGGREIKIVRLTGREYRSGNPKVFVTFNMHAREWIAGMSGVYTVEHLVAKAKESPNYLANTEVVLMPMANPDGFVRSVSTDRMHSKNTRTVSWTCKGVDLNRNFDAHWASGGSSGRKCSDTYHGLAAMSEPETKAIAKVMNESPMTVYINVNAFSQQVLTASSWTTMSHPRNGEYRTLGKSIQTAIKNRHGATFQVGASAKILYPASGSPVDYADDRGALGFAFELSPAQWRDGGFAPPPTTILPAAEECYDGILAAIYYAVTHG